MNAWQKCLLASAPQPLNQNLQSRFPGGLYAYLILRNPSQKLHTCKPKPRSFCGYEILNLLGIQVHPWNFVVHRGLWQNYKASNFIENSKKDGTTLPLMTVKVIIPENSIHLKTTFCSVSMHLLLVPKVIKLCTAWSRQEGQRGEVILENKASWKVSQIHSRFLIPLG